ncbi:MAG: hypothetical protein ACI4VQ_00520 [Clostridia bacterium]
MDINQTESNELIEIYNKIDAFIKFLEKEKNDAEKLGESNE